MGVLWWVVTWLFSLEFLFLVLVGPNLIVYLIHQVLLGYYFKDRDLKRRYNAKWGLVTGASSGRHQGNCFKRKVRELKQAWLCLAGIGKALAMRLADQGVNVVLVAKPDELLNDTHAEMQSIYKNLQIRKASMALKPL